MTTVKKPILPSWRGHYAGFASRLLAIVIDVFILCIALAVTTVLYNVVIKNLISVSRLFFGREVIQPTTSGGVIISVLVVFFVFGIYFVFLWSFLGSTLGGLILGIRIVNRKGKNPSFFQALIRYLFEFFFPFIGVIESLWILFTHQRRAIFDMVAGTYVIYAWDARPDETFLVHETSHIVSGNPEEGHQA